MITLRTAKETTFDGFIASFNAQALPARKAEILNKNGEVAAKEAFTHGRYSEVLKFYAPFRSDRYDVISIAAGEVLVSLLKDPARAGQVYSYAECSEDEWSNLLWLAGEARYQGNVTNHDFHRFLVNLTTHFAWQGKLLEELCQEMISAQEFYLLRTKVDLRVAFRHLGLAIFGSSWESWTTESLVQSIKDVDPEIINSFLITGMLLGEIGRLSTNLQGESV